jgi:multimeric flavodoxin WrbA
MSNRKPVVFVIYYSTFGHIETLAKSVMDGLQKSGVDAKLFQVAETLPGKFPNGFGSFFSRF